MPIVQTVGSLSTQAFGGVTHAGNTKPPSSPPYAGCEISPSINGQPKVDLQRVTLSTCGTWTITPINDFYSNVKMWGAGGGAGLTHPTGGANGIGGQGGFSKGNVQFLAGVTYQFIVGCGGGGTSTARAGGGGGGGTGIRISSGSVPILVAGAGGGGGYSGTNFVYGGNGGGTTGETGRGESGGRGGSQIAAGAGGVGRQGTGGTGSGNNAGPGAGGAGGGAGGVGFGNGGGGRFVVGDAGGGGGGAGYFGAGGGGYDSDGSGGGGGSSYYNPTYVSTSTLTQGYGVDTARGTAGAGGTNGSVGQVGKIVITRDPV